MFSKSLAASILLLVFTSSVNADVLFKPALGSPAEPLHPQDGNPCAGIPISTNIDSSSCAVADLKGNFSISVSGVGSDVPAIKAMTLSADGKGHTFSTVPQAYHGVMDVNGGSSQTITAQLPPGTTCTGGADKNRCLIAITAKDGSGNCLVVSQPTRPTPVPSSTPSANPHGGDAPKANPASNADSGSADAKGDGKGNSKDNVNAANVKDSTTKNSSKRDNEARKHSRDFKRD